MSSDSVIKAYIVYQKSREFHEAPPSFDIFESQQEAIDFIVAQVMESAQQIHLPGHVSPKTIIEKLRRPSGHVFSFVTNQDLHQNTKHYIGFTSIYIPKDTSTWGKSERDARLDPPLEENPSTLLDFNGRSVRPGDGLMLEWLEELKGQDYESFKRNLIEKARGGDNHLYTKKLLNQKVYSKDFITIHIPRIENDEEKLVTVTWSQPGGFTNGQLFYNMANNLEKFTGDFAEDWYHVLKYLERQGDGTYHLRYVVYC